VKQLWPVPGLAFVPVTPALTRRAFFRVWWLIVGSYTPEGGPYGEA
jgi:hypothetical protein